MGEDVIERLEFINSRLGYTKLSDGSIVILRVAVVDVRVRGSSSPFGIDFEVNATTGLSVYPSKDAVEEVKDKPILEPGKTINKGWVRVDIVEKKPAYEEVRFTDEGVGTYVVRVEIEPIMASRNVMVKTIRNEPLYVIRWVPKITWREASSKGGTKS